MVQLDPIAGGLFAGVVFFDFLDDFVGLFIAVEAFNVWQ